MLLDSNQVMFGEVWEEGGGGGSVLTVPFNLELCKNNLTWSNSVIISVVVDRNYVYMLF